MRWTREAGMDSSNAHLTEALGRPVGWRRDASPAGRVLER